MLSHLGSFAVIMQCRLDDALAGRETPDDAPPAVWDTWNTKTAAAKRDDVLNTGTDRRRPPGAVTADERGRFTFAMGSMTFGFDFFLGLHVDGPAMRTWDIEIASDRSATIPAALASPVVDTLELTAPLTATPTGDTAAMSVLTTAPDHGYVELEPIRQHSSHCGDELG